MACYCVREQVNKLDFAVWNIVFIAVLFLVRLRCIVCMMSVDVPMGAQCLPPP